MLNGEIIAVCSQIHTKHINTLCGQNVELLNVKLAVHIVTTGTPRRVTVTHTLGTAAFHAVLIINCITSLVSVIKTRRVFSEVGFELLNVIYMSSML